MADKPKSYGQFDQGAGQRYAQRKTGKAKKMEASSSPSATRSRSTNSDRQQQDVKSEDDVRRDMRQHRRDVATGVVRAIKGAL